jgi:pyrroloquinoline quinone (PQQ) biosynthesis protein C
MAERFISSFDALVLSFPTLIALGIAKTDDEDARAVLAANLYQECGEGDATRTHHAIFRKFVSTIDLEFSLLSCSTSAEKWRSSMRQAILESGCSLEALAVLAAGEFLAQPALTQIFSVIRKLYPGADVEYFTSHLELETEHVREITALLYRQVDRGGSEDTAIAGFAKGLAVWNLFFDEMHTLLFTNAQDSAGTDGKTVSSLNFELRATSHDRALLRRKENKWLTK